MSSFVCPNCGASVANEYKICKNCGYDFSKGNLETNVQQPNKAINEPPPIQPIQQPGNSTNIKLIIFCIVAAVILVISFVAANSISDGGNAIMQINSVGGNTLEEAYYHQLGSIYSGYAMFVRICGIFFSSILINQGLKK